MQVTPPASTFAAVCITWVAALVALILRVVARRMTKQRWWIDDYFCVAAFVFASGFNTIVLIWTVRYRFGQTLDPSLTADEKEDLLLHARRLMLGIEYCYAASIVCTKFTILTLYWRLFSLSSIRIPIQVMFVVSGMWIIVRTFMVSFQCQPFAYYWDKSIDGRCTINDAQFFFATILTHCIMDIVILSLPVIEVGKLHLRAGQKIGVICLFLVGLIVCIASIVCIVESIRYDPKTTELTRDVAPGFLWGNIEMNLAIVSACFPLLRPVFRHVLPHSFLSSYGSSHPISRTNHSHAIRLSTIPKTKERYIDESSSTHQLADLEQAVPRTSDFDQIPDTVHTVISSHLRTSQNFSAGERDMNGIHVKKDMVVKVEERDFTFAMRR